MILELFNLPRFQKVLKLDIPSGRLLWRETRIWYENFLQVLWKDKKNQSIQSQRGFFEEIRYISYGSSLPSQQKSGKEL